MDLIVAVYDDWGIGRDGTQPVALKADRKFFREMTRGATVIAGRRTVEDFPGRQPLPNRRNIVLTRSDKPMPGFLVCHSPQEAMEQTQADKKVMVIGGGSVYRQMLPYCTRAIVTKVHTAVACDTFFPDLDASGQWQLQQVMCAGEEAGIAYEMCVYIKNKEYKECSYA